MFNSRGHHLLKKIINTHLRSSLRFHTCTTEIRIPVPWGHVAGKWWGPTNQRPILTLHGWQDNCGSFNRLIPLLKEDVGFLAIDFPGHGLSSRLHHGMYYHFMKYIILVQYLKDYFKWPKVSLLGHSMGGIISFVYTMIHPNNVDFLICLDGAKPMVQHNNVERIARQIQRFPKYVQQEMSTAEPPCYTMEEIIKKVCVPNTNSVSYEHSHHLIERNVAPSKNHPGKYYFTRDPRLKASELMNFPQDDSVEFTRSITCPALIVKAIGGSYYETKKNFYAVLDVLKKSSVDCQYHRLDGTHHLHLNNPEVLAEVINQFIDKHNCVDREIGGIKKEMIQQN